MKILLINHLYPDGGGAEAAVRGLVAFLKVQRHEVAVLTLGDETAKGGMSGRYEGGVQIYSYKTLSRRFSEKLIVCLCYDRPPAAAFYEATICNDLSKTKRVNRRTNNRLWRAGSICKRVFFRAAAFLCDWINLIGPLKTLRLIRKIRPDVVHTHNLRGMGMFLPFAIRLARWTPPPTLSWALRCFAHRSARLKRLEVKQFTSRYAPTPFWGRTRWRWIHTVHDIQLAYPSGVASYSNPEQKFEIARRLYERLQRSVWGSPDVVVSPSDFLKRFYAERGFFKNSKFNVIPNVIIGTAQRDEERGNGKNSILFVGALEESKGVQILLKAAQMAGQDFQRRAITLDIIGDGSLRQQLAEKYARYPWIRFRGSLKAETLASYYARTLATVIPSLTLENAPMAILESFHFGVSVIASRIGGIPEYVREGETGWLFTPGSVDELAALLRKIINDGVSEEISRNCQRVLVDLGVQAYAGHAVLYNSS